MWKCNLKKWSNYKTHHNFRCWEQNSKFLDVALIYIHYHLLHQFILKSSSTYQVRVVKNHVYHFWFLSIDVTLCQHSSQSTIEHLISHAWLEFEVYVSLCYHEVKIYIIVWNLLYVNLHNPMTFYHVVS
jgi:hypothetical protein